ncbi:MAG: single-stranded DNA-binding protein, partial [Mesotoga sp.]|nr:single-stranded DNA-binding protein [Mesotoga sp.]
MGISYNKIILVGRLTRDPESKFATSGTAITTFSLAVDRDYPKDSNEA